MGYSSGLSLGRKHGSISGGAAEPRRQASARVESVDSVVLLCSNYSRFTPFSRELNNLFCKPSNFSGAIQLKIVHHNRIRQGH